jgi:hypothetical protein
MVFESLRKVANTFPFHGMEPEHVKDQARIRTALDVLRAARDAEAGGLETLQRIVNEL